MYGSKRKAFIFTLMSIALFSLGRFYVEVEAFFNTPYSVIGLLFATIGFLVYYIQWQKLQKERAYRSRDEYAQQNEEHRRDIRILEGKLNKKKNK